MHASHQVGFHFAQLGLQPFTHRLPEQREPLASGLAADMRKAKEVEGLGFPLTTQLAGFSRELAELQQASFVRMQLQSELPQSFGEFVPEPLGIGPMLESEHNVVGVAYDNHVAARLLATPHQ